MQPVALLTDTGCRRSLISYPESLVISAGASRRRQATVFPQAVSGCSRCRAQDGATAAKGGICFFDALVMLTGGHPWMPAGT